jgi:hypothetical protein
MKKKFISSTLPVLALLICFLLLKIRPWKKHQFLLLPSKPDLPLFGINGNQIPFIS